MGYLRSTAKINPIFLVRVCAGLRERNIPLPTHTGIILWTRVEKPLIRYSHILRSYIFILGHLYKVK